MLKIITFCSILSPFALMAQIVLPDLVPVADEDNGWLYDYEVDTFHDHAAGHIDRTVLRFSAALANIGRAPLDMVGGVIYTNSNGEETRDVHQNIYNEAGEIVDSPLAGTFVFHDFHQHVHYDSFASYSMRLVPVGGLVGGEDPIIAESSKVGFCLISTDLIDADIAASTVAYVTDTVTDITLCNNTHQVIQSGYADVYSKDLSDQWIDITGLTLQGDYWLEVVVDPLNQIQESDETNNVIRIPITLNVPEPSSTLLVGLAGGLLAFQRSRKQ